MKVAAFSGKLIVTFIFVCCVQAVTAQNWNICGRVYDENNQLVAGPTICIQQMVACDWDGFFNFKDTQDSLKLSVQWIGYLPYEKKLPRDYEGDWDIYLEPNPELENYIFSFGLPYGIKSGHLFTKNREPISEAVITSKGKGRPTRNNISIKDGFFETRDNGYTELSILVDGHKPFEYTFQSTGEKSSWIEHDGLFIVLTFY